MASEVRAQWLVPTVEAVTAIMCSAAPLEYKVRAACAALVDHAMASGAWLMAPNEDQLSILAAEDPDEDLKPIVSDAELNELLLKRIHDVASESERSFEPVVVRGFDALGVERDFACVALVLAGRVIGTLSCLFRRDVRRSDDELHAIEVVARIIAVALQSARDEAKKAIAKVQSAQAQAREATEAAEAFKTDAARFEALIRSLPGSIVIVNPRGVMTQIIPGSHLSQPLPLAEQGERGLTYAFTSEHFAEGHNVAMRKAMNGLPSRCHVQVLASEAGQKNIRIIEESFQPLIDERGEVTEILGYARDVTEQMAMVEALRQLRERDTITDCMTMAALRERTAREIESHTASNIPMAFFAIEIDKSGTGAHLLGQNTFEELLQTVAARIRRHLPKVHLLARRSEHSFVAVTRLPAGTTDASKVGEQIVRVLRDPIITGRFEHFLLVSVGHSVFPRDGSTMEEMFANADIAATNVMRFRRNAALAFTAEMGNEAAERVRIESSLHRAVDQEEFMLAYQPKIHLVDGSVSGVEALVRWSGKNAVPPAKFIPIAEECGLISFIGEWALRQACHAARRWTEQGLRIPVSVNVSTRQFHDNDFHYIVREILEETGCDPTLLELEVTEGVMFEDPSSAVECFTMLKQMGVKLSIDDFGMGYSNLGYLKNLPMDALKIDRTFIEGLPSDEGSAVITKAIIGMARAMGMRTVAEGVESATCLQYLQDLGCDEVQGFYFAQPLFEQQFLDWYSSHQSRCKAGQSLEDKPVV